MITKTSIYYQEDLAPAFELSPFLSHGTCTVCNKNTEFAIDSDYPDLFMTYRESARCVQCNLIARQRVVMTAVKLFAQPGNVVYLQEQVTSSYEWAVKNLTECTVIGSEYVPNGGPPDIRHENVESLSFADASTDIIVSQDVFEHVANPWQGFAECYRVLIPGGRMFMTIPFAGDPAHLTVDRVKQGLPDRYHGNPLNDQGSLVYSDFGWDLVRRLKKIGFAVEMSVYRCSELGWASPILLFELIKPVSSNPVVPV
jgi:SAM-dependent methyltransferase